MMEGIFYWLHFLMLTRMWKQQNQVIDIKQVDSTRALNTSEELNRSLLANDLDIQNCKAFQSNNCNAMITAHPLLVSDDMQSLPDDDFNGCPLNTPFVGCGAHRLNNCTLDSVINIPFLRQLNASCKEFSGPMLANTRWYSHVRPVEFLKSNLEFLSTPRNQVRYSALDTHLCEQMIKVLKYLQELGQFLESERPVADLVIPQINRLRQYLAKVLEWHTLRDPAKNFVSQLYSRMQLVRRFGDFPDIMKCATFLNPKKAVRKFVAENELEMLKRRLIISFDSNPKSLTTIEIISTSEIHQPNDSANDIDDFEAACRNDTSEASASTIRNSKTMEKELCSFLACTDVDKTAYNYFKEKEQSIPSSQSAQKLWSCFYRQE